MSMRSPVAELIGSQVPTYRNVPQYRQTAADEAIDLARVAGLVLDPWEELALRDALGLRLDARTWASFEVALVVPRQNGKGTVLEARALAGLFLFGEDLITWSAHEFKTAVEGFRRLRRLIEDNRDFERKVKIIRTASGQEGIELRSGQRIRFMARSRGAGRGFSGDTVILDEAYNLPAEALAAALPTMSARPNPQMWYTSSAPLPTPESDVLRRVCKKGRAGSPRLAYLEWCAPTDSAIDDPDALAAANPGLGIRLNLDVIDAERGSLDPGDFARERLGIWTEEDRNPRIIPAEVWAACQDEESKPTGPLCFALDVSPDRAWSTIVMAAESDRGGVHVEITGNDEVYDHRPGTGWVVGRAVELQGRWGGKVAVAKGSPAWSLKEDLEAAKVDLLVVSTEEHSQACGDLYDAVVESRLRHVGQDELDAAVAGADRRFYGDAWLWSRRSSSVDISPLVAVTLAHWVAQKRQRRPKIW